MQWSPATKQTVLGVSLGLVIFYFIKKAIEKKSGNGPIENAVQKPITQENIGIVLDAYSSAVNDKAEKSVLNDLNKNFADEYGLRVYQRKSDEKFVVTDLSGKEVKVV